VLWSTVVRSMEERATWVLSSSVMVVLFDRS
jgi:hypothetical protein